MKKPSLPVFPTATTLLLMLLLLILRPYLVLSAADASNSPLPLELVSLLSLKSSLHDPFSSFHDWDPTPTFSKPNFEDKVWCSWSGIKCNPKTAQIISLDLSYRNLSGLVPPEIRYLSSLIHLNLSHNAFRGPLQPAILDLTELRTLDIGWNSFNSTFSPGISKLKFLRFFNAYNNNFTGPLPLEFSQLRFLEYLNLGGSYFEGQIPPGYGSLPRLKSLFLHGNLLEGPLPPELGNLSKLEHLEIGYNDYSGGLPLEIARLSNLKYLDISTASLSGSIPEGLANLTKLESLYLFDNQFNGSIPLSFGRLEALTVFDLSQNQLSGTIPEGVASMKRLTILDLMSNNLTGEIPPGIGELPELHTLRLWGNSLTGMLPQSLGSNAKLVWLDVCSNFLSGQIPPNLCLGNKLVRLILFSNRFDGELPSSLTNCSTLWRFRAAHNMLNGSISLGFGLLPNLTFIDLSNNNFSGEIPGDLGNAVALEYLNISGNSFQSNLPSNIWNASKLKIFSASSAKIIGRIPDFSVCRSLYKIELGGNSLNGSIPLDMSHCENLQSVNLSRNSLSGIIPTNISTIPTIADLDFSYNALTGTIPPSFGNCRTLENFNVSYNSLTGPVPLGPVFKNLHPSSFIGNEGLCGDVLATPCNANDDTPNNNQQPKRTAGAIVWIMAAAFGVGLFLLIAGSRCLFQAGYSRRCINNETRGTGPWKLTAFQRLNFTADDVVECMSMSDTIIGMGSTGMVYRTKMPGGEIIAVKKLWGKPKEHSRKRRGVLAEVDVLGNVRHRNIVRLLGCCSNRECTMLLYEYMPNGNLDDLLHCKSKEDNLVANWMTRYKIALGVAQGICYLHHDCDPVIVHRDLKSSNILLDAEMEARVADFGLAKLLQSDESMSVIAGSYGYIAPEYAYTLQVDEKSDIYSFGVVLMEILSGRRSVDREFGEGNSIVDWIRSKIKTKEGLIQVLDKNAGASCASIREEMIQVLRIALLCTSRNPGDRPSMRDVVMMLEEARPKRKLPENGDIGGNANDVPTPQKPAVVC